MGEILKTSAWKTLAVIVSAGFLLRLYAVCNAVTVSADSVEYINLAKEFKEGNFYGVLNAKRPPLYPILIGVASFMTDDYESSGRIVSLAAGTLVILAGFYLGRFIYNENAGIVLAFFISIHPYMIRYSGDVLTESLYHLLVSALIFSGLKAVIERTWKWILLVWVFSLLSYLTKPAGVIFLIVTTIWMVLYNPPKMRVGLWARCWIAFSLWAMFAVTALPYLLFIYNQTGEVGVTGKLSVEGFFTRVGSGFLSSSKLLDFLKYLPEAFTIPFFLLFLWGVYARGREGLSVKEWFIVTAVVSYWLICIGILPRRRYLVQVLTVGLLFSSIGFLYLKERLGLRFKERAYLFLSIITVLILSVEIPKGVRPLKMHRLAERQAGEYILKTFGSGMTIISDKPIVVFYAEGRHLPLEDRRLTVEDVVNYGKTHGADYLAGYPSRLAGFIEDFMEMEGSLRRIKSFKGSDGDEFVIYRIPHHG